jgi:hypothetical protein
MHADKLIVPEPSPFGIEIAIAKLKKHKSPGSDQIPVEMILASDDKLLSEIVNLLIPLGIRKNCLISARSVLFYEFARRAMKLTVLNIEEYHYYQILTKFIHYPS